MSDDTERWLPVVGYEGYYEVSDFGRVRSLDRLVPRRGQGTLRVKGRVLSPGTHGTEWGERFVVGLSRDGSTVNARIAPLVLAAFVGPRPAGAVACHDNGDSTDDRLSNLRWDTPRENNLDMLRHGTHELAARTHCPRGHLLVEPNLCPSTKAIGRRLCLACNRAHGNVRYARQTGRELDLKETADEHYNRIMGG